MSTQYPVRNAPGTPLPWVGGLPYKTNIYGRARDVIKKDDAYELHAANAYPRLVDMVRVLRVGGAEVRDEADALLRELGEPT